MKPDYVVSGDFDTGLFTIECRGSILVSMRIKELNQNDPDFQEHLYVHLRMGFENAFRHGLDKAVEAVGDKILEIRR